MTERDPNPHGAIRQPKATVILLCYNQEGTVGRAIESVLRQQCAYPFEVLVADDCSTDSTREICARYAAMYPDVVRMLPEHPNKGIVDNYFDALLAARGEYVADCAGDDEWLDPSRMERSIRLLDENPDVPVVFTDTEVYDGKRVPDSVRHNAPNSAVTPAADAVRRIKGSDIMAHVLNHTNSLPYVLSAALFRRLPVAQALEREPDVIRCHDAGIEDVPMIALLAREGDALHLPLTGYRYYVDGESVSNNLSDEKDYRFTSRVTSLVRRLGEYYGIPQEAQEAHFREKFSYMAAKARRSGNKELWKDFDRRRREWRLTLPLRARVHRLLASVGYKK